jgi:hypothetical protein
VQIQHLLEMCVYFQILQKYLEELLLKIESQIKYGGSVL